MDLIMSRLIIKEILMMEQSKQIQNNILYIFHSQFSLFIMDDNVIITSNIELCIRPVYPALDNVAEWGVLWSLLSDGWPP